MRRGDGEEPCLTQIADKREGFGVFSLSYVGGHANVSMLPGLSSGHLKASDIINTLAMLLLYIF